MGRYLSFLEFVMSLKDALLKAGYQSSKTQNERKKKLKKEKTKTEKHQEHRNFCEVCETTQPDVELFKHRNPRIDAEWICSNCADKNEILDDFRITGQSDFARNRRYRRYYGHTRDLDKEKKSIVKDERKKPSYKHELDRKNNRGNQKNTDKSRRQKGRTGGVNYTLDENGDKNFNC